MYYDRYGANEDQPGSVSVASSVEEFLRPKCKVKAGDCIRKGNKRWYVSEVIPAQDGYLLKCRSMYHADGSIERTFSDMIFNDDSWIIETQAR